MLTLAAMLKTTVRELARHALYITGMGGVLNHRRQRRGQDTGHLTRKDRREVFSYVYERGIWLNASNDGSLSGIGSELAATVELRRDLENTPRELGITSLLDVGCGDFTWMQHVDLAGIDYTGVDVVESVIDANTATYGSANRRFVVVDAVSEPLPTSDAVLCREVIFHLSFADGLAMLDNVRNSGAKYLIATHDTGTAFNSDIRTGDFRILNLERRPYNLPAPYRWIADSAVSPTRGLAFWPLA